MCGEILGFICIYAVLCVFEKAIKQFQKISVETSLRRLSFTRIAQAGVITILEEKTVVKRFYYEAIKALKSFQQTISIKISS